VLTRSVLVLLLAASVVAQQPSQPTFRTEANYVRVDAYPTHDGAPVLDLKQNDFEIVENGAVQRIEQFEHVLVTGNTPQELRREPNTVAESREAIQNPRSRVFVVFLDIGHVEVEGSHRIRQPLIDTLNKLIGEDDLVAVMTPEMSALDLTFARKTTTLEGLLTRHWYWGERGQMVKTDPVEQEYEACFPPPNERVAQAMIARRREKQTLDAFQDLARYLRGAREERKAVIVVTDGWVLYTPDERLAGSAVPTAGPEIGLNPGTGRLQSGNANRPGEIGTDQCLRDLMFLSRLDNASEFRQILDEANYANTSFYPIDPRGLPVFDSPISNPLPLAVDAAALRTQANSLRMLAENTDGLAMVNSNNLEGSFRKIVADLSSYYLLGYYSSGKLDGKFHSITVRVKRPGVAVRARRGYLAASPAAAPTTSGGGSTAAPTGPADMDAPAVAAAITPLANFTREVPLRTGVAAGWRTGDRPSAFVVVEGELSASREYEDLWRGGATTAIELAPNDGPSVASARVTIPAGTRSFRAVLTPSQPLAPGDYVVRTSARGSDAIPLRDTLRLTLAASPLASGAIWFRHGPSTMNKDTPTADLRFRRSEQAIVEVPTSATAAPAVRLLDRLGKALAIPVASSQRDDTDGTRWTRAQVALAPLGTGDYVIELSEGGSRTLAAFKVVP
jgi:VWFA-related protein